ncbi:ShKT domain-containing protein [Caenorhabditis elegans]|uniref:ShKT domain-containing protein n=1 Tax=Caenorhabditis elegans TaxID=6239 RepID=Q7YXD7_CAEEL|nr:ShKT domain-containing protein [Caenorhabditis elegans]CAB54388.1 ShKT domain-containing protein [Caenorhabditis elegans]|eukprot:NP_001022432.1 Uncharacterized protein CELE_Y39G8B.9 [Caenorhabditis elegans]
MKYLIVLCLVIAVALAKPQNLLEKLLQKPDVDTCATAKDLGPNCVNWARNGFCTNCQWTCAQRKHYCERTCGFCHPDYVCNEQCLTQAPRIMKELSKEEIEMLNRQ